jgi:orotate phosphoribosyltransferase
MTNVVAARRQAVEAAIADVEADCPGYREHIAAEQALRLAEATRALLELPNLFQAGDFTLRSGKKSAYKIECDALTPDDWAGIAAAVMEERLIDVPFSDVVGVPRGGVPFAAAMRRYVTPGVRTLLICEDVVTTGGSIERYKLEQVKQWEWDAIRGLCFVARGKCPDWIAPLLQMRLPSLT